MQKIALSLLMVLFLFVGCSKDDQPAETYEYTKNNLLGKYSLTSWKYEETITEEVRGFEVKTTKVLIGDTFDMFLTFNEDNTLVYDGAFRVTQTITQNNQTVDSTYILVKNQEVAEYSVRTSSNELKIDELMYDVTNFNPRGFDLNLNEITIEDDVITEVLFQASLKR